MKKLTTARLIRIFAGELLKLSQHPKYRKEMEKKKRKESNEDIIRRLKEKKGMPHSDQEALDLSPGWQERQVQEKIKKIKNIIDLGRGDFGYEKSEDDPYLMASLEYWDQIEESRLHDNEKEGKLLAKKYQAKYKKLDGLENCLNKVFEDGGVSFEEYVTVQFYLLPEKEFGKANVGPSSNLKNPDERDIWDQIEDIDLNYATIVIYSDDESKYQDMINKILSKSESGKYVS